MPDAEIRDLLVAYTEEGPPPSFTFDGIVASGRKRRRRRRILAVGASAAAVVAVATGLAMAAPREEAQRLPAATVPAGPFWATLDPKPFCATANRPPTGPTIAPTSVASEKNGYLIRIPTEPAGHAAARISCYLATAVPPRLEGTDFYRDTATPAGTTPLQAFPLRTFDPARPGDTAPPIVSASAVLRDEDGVGEIGFGVSAASESEAEVRAGCDGPCTVRIGPHGETVTVLDVRTPAGFRLVNIWIYRGDCAMFASASNGVTGPTASGEAGVLENETPGRKDLPLSVDDLIDLASAPEMTLFP